MIKRLFFFANMLACTWLPALNNPFSCNRTITRSEKPQASLLKNFKFIGIVDTEAHRQVILQWQGDMYTLHAGDKVGPVKIKEIHDKNIRIVVAKEEFILALESEQCP